MERRKFLQKSIGLGLGSILAFIGLSRPSGVLAATTHKQLRYIVPFNGNPDDQDRYEYAAQIAIETRLKRGTSERFWLRYRGSSGGLYVRPVEVFKLPNGTNLVEFYHGDYYQFEDGEYL